MNPKHLLIKLIIAHGFCCVIGQSSENSPTKLNDVPPIKQPDVSKWMGVDPTSYFRENSLANTFDQIVSFDQYIDYAMRALALVAGFDNDLHRYDREGDVFNSYNRNLSSKQIENSIELPAKLLGAAESDRLDDRGDSSLADNQLNQVECGLQLDAISKLASKLFSSPQEFSQSRQLDFIDYLDSFGGPSAQLMQGNFLWLGSHEQCLNSKLSLQVGEAGLRQEVGSRYCIAKFRSPEWPTAKSDANLIRDTSIKLGVCLPRSCNSISYIPHRNRIESLIKLVRLNQVPHSSYKLAQLFCLPDEGSPMRQFSLSAQMFLVSLVVWLSVLVYYSLKYEYQRMQWLSKPGNSLAEFNANMTDSIKIFAFRLSWSKLFESSASSEIRESPKNVQLFAMDTGSAEPSDADCYNFNHKAQLASEQHLESGREFLSDSNNNGTGGVILITSQQASKTFDVPETLGRQSNIQNSKLANLLEVSLRQGSIINKKQKPALLVVNQVNQVQTKSPKSPSVDLSVIDGIKVLSMIWLISGHTLLFFIRTIANGRDFWSVLKDARFMTIMAGIFPVDTFFTITGILTAYLKFNKNSGVAMGRPGYWFEAFVHRYLRFMPMYLIVFWYTRDVSEYIGNGPLWDYATADTSLRSVCKQESVLVPILFQANFKPIDQHCVKPAWYLANDYQYLLLTPVFIGLIMKSRILGYTVIGLSILASLVLQFLTVYQSVDLDDFETIINFKPMFGAYVLKNLWRLYVLPYNRIPPYLIGIMTGHMMYIKSKTTSAQKPQNDTPLNRSGVAKWDRSQDSLTSATEIHHRSTATIFSDSTALYTRHFLKLTGDLTDYLCIKIWTPLMFLISIIYLPMITRILTLEGLTAKIGTSSVIALMRFVWSMAIARLIYICSTRSFRTSSQKCREDSFVIRLLSSPKWRPWARIGLSALLIQWEIISYLAQIQTSAPNMTISFLLAIVLICIAATYSLALLIYLTLEYPLSKVEQLYLHTAIFRKT